MFHNISTLGQLKCDANGSLLVRGETLPTSAMKPVPQNGSIRCSGNENRLIRYCSYRDFRLMRTFTSSQKHAAIDVFCYL